MIKLTNKQIQEICDYLQGSCHSLEEAITEITEDAADSLEAIENWRELCATLDDQHFLCVQCGWWSEAGDYAEIQENPNGDVCSDCGPDEEDEDA